VAGKTSLAPHRSGTRRGHRLILADNHGEIGVEDVVAKILASQPQVREESPKSPRRGPDTWAPNPGGATGAATGAGDCGMLSPGGG
jgi:hypothetical protein